MFESYFAPAERRRRLVPAELLARYPELSYDEEQYEDSLPDLPYLRSVLDRYVAQLSGEGPTPWEWGPATSAAVRQHPIYLDARYAGATLQDLPTLSKAVLRRHPEPFDHQAEPTPVVYTDKTSGTSGAPLAIAYSQQFMSQSLYLEIIKIMLRAELTDLGAGEVLSVFLTDNPNRGPGIVIPNPLDLVGHTLIVHVDPSDAQSLTRVTAMLHDLRPEVLSSKPNLFRMLLNRWGGQSPFGPYQPRLAVSGGAMLSVELRHEIADALGCPVVSSYAISEAGYLGSECPHGGMHLDRSVHQVFEVLDDSATAADIGELVITALSNSCMPLLRYRVGDVVMLADACACGRSGPTLAELRGRTTQIFELGDGVQLSPTRYMKIFERHPALHEFQLIQVTERAFRLRIEIDPSVTDLVRQETVAAVRDYISAGMPVSVEIDCAEDVFDTIGGKFTRFRSEVAA